VTPRTLSGGPEAHIALSEFTDCGCGPSLLEVQVALTATVRQAKLKPECADFYPTLPARMWTPAACLTELVTSYRRARPDKPEKGRSLSEADFEFRGGFPRQLGGWFARTRTGELTYTGSG
jgi:hypothetical protein